MDTPSIYHRFNGCIIDNDTFSRRDLIHFRELSTDECFDFIEDFLYLVRNLKSKFLIHGFYKKLLQFPINNNKDRLNYYIKLHKWDKIRNLFNNFDRFTLKCGVNCFIKFFIPYLHITVNMKLRRSFDSLMHEFTILGYLQDYDDYIYLDEDLVILTPFFNKYTLKCLDNFTYKLFKLQADSGFPNYIELPSLPPQIRGCLIAVNDNVQDLICSSD